MASVEKKILRIGLRGRGASPEGAFAGVSQNINLETFETRADAGIGIGADPQFDGTCYVIATPAKAHTRHGPITAIAIAADSPIESVDIHIANAGGETCHRIAPGCPFVGEISEDSVVYVTPNRTIPQIHRDSSGVQVFADFARSNVVWECELSQDVASKGGATVVAAPLIPVKLEVYRGCYPTAIRRAPYSGSLVWAVDTAGGAPINPGLFLITDGRKRVRVVATAETGSADATLEVYGIESLKDPWTASIRAANDKAFGPKRDQPVFDQLMAPTAIPQRPTPLIFDYGPNQGNPYFAFYARITSITDQDHGTLEIHAWDD